MASKAQAASSPDNPTKIGELFTESVDRPIEEVIKVDQQLDEVLVLELKEYVITSHIAQSMERVLGGYKAAANKPTEGIGVWVSGFFGSGKSSFAKLLGLAIENREIAGETRGATGWTNIQPVEKKQSAQPENESTVPFGELFCGKLKSKGQPNDLAHKQVFSLLKGINENQPTVGVIFDVSTDRGIRSGNQTLTEIMYGKLLEKLGYARDLDLSELEITLEGDNKLEAFKEKYRALYRGKEWDREKTKVAFAISEASKVMHSLDPETYPHADSWAKAAKNRSDITPGKLAERVSELMERRGQNRNLVFVIDEVGQFVARDVQKMLDLQAVVQQLGIRGRGKHWLVVTSQERLNEVVAGIDDKKIELSRLQDRFNEMVHLEPADISEVTSRRVLAKNSAGEEALGRLFDERSGKLKACTRVTADITLPVLSRDAFVHLYPFLPYQIDLIINVVSGLRTQKGASSHVGGANRTIIKLAQQVLINPATRLGNREIGHLVTLDQVYDLVENNIDSQLRLKIGNISREVSHPLGQVVAKAVCLLQFVQTVHRTAENIAAVLHPSVEADSRLQEVREALEVLEKARKVRLGEDGYRIPTPSEDTWETLRNGIQANPSDIHRLQQAALLALWKPVPDHELEGVQKFRAGLFVKRELVAGEIMVHLELCESPERYQAEREELRERSRSDKQSLFWVVKLDREIDALGEELHRSNEMISRNERGARTTEENRLVAEEKSRRNRLEADFKNLLRLRCLTTGCIYFRGEDRSPGDKDNDIIRLISDRLGSILPHVYFRFGDGAARAREAADAVEALLDAENLNGLPDLFHRLRLIVLKDGLPRFNTEGPSLGEVSTRITSKSSTGGASGKWLAEELGKEPYGWGIDIVRLFTLALLRDGKIEAVSEGDVIDSSTHPAARKLFTKNTQFNAATFRARGGTIDFAELVGVYQQFSLTFGHDEVDFNQPKTFADGIRDNLQKREGALRKVLDELADLGLPGTGLIQKAKALSEQIGSKSLQPEKVIREFSQHHQLLADAFHRAGSLEKVLNPAVVVALKEAQLFVRNQLAELEQDAENPLPAPLETQAASLRDWMAREQFFNHLAEMDQATRLLRAEYTVRSQAFLESRQKSYRLALEKLEAAEGWAGLDSARQAQIQASLVRGAESQPAPLAQMRSDIDACPQRLQTALMKVQELARPKLPVSTFRLGERFTRAITTEKQVEMIVEELREELLELVRKGHQVFLQ